MAGRRQAGSRGQRTDPTLPTRALPARRRIRVWVLLLAVVGLAAAGALYLGLFTGSDGTSPESIPPPAARSGEPVRAPPASEVNPSAPVALPPDSATSEDLKEMAFAVVRQLMADFPNSSDPIGLMGTTYDHFDMPDEAEKWWLKCLERNPKRADVFVGLAALAARKGEHEKAAAYWLKAQQVDPRMPGTYSGYGAALLELGKADEALDALEKERMRSPNDSGVFLLTGKAHTQRKDYEKALEDFQQAVEIAPNDTRVLFALSAAYARVGQKDKADEALAKFRPLRAEEDEATNQRKKAAGKRTFAAHVLAGTLADAGVLYVAHRNAAKAEEYWRRAAALDPGNKACRQSLVELYRATGHLPEALECCRHLQALAPKDATCAVNLGVLLIETGQYDAAEQALRKALELGPKHAPAYRGLARLLLARGRNLPEARTLTDRLVVLDPSAVNYALLAEASSRNGDLPGARAAIGRALELDPRNPQIRAAHAALQEKP